MKKRFEDNKWEKILYRENRCDDNFTHESFLEDMVLNAYVKKREYKIIVYESLTLIQQISTVVLVISVSFHLYRENVSFSFIFTLCFTGLILGFLLCYIIGSHILGGSMVRGFKQCCLLCTGVYMLSPLYQSLTESISSDSIVALSCFLLAIHLYLHDYNFVNSVTDKLTGSVSLGSAIFSSVLIASRLKSINHVILLSLELYLLAPFVRRYIRQKSSMAHIILTMIMLILSIMMLVSISNVITLIYVMIVLFTCIISPVCLVNLDKFKSMINGPWDEAVPNIPMKLIRKFCENK